MRPRRAACRGQFGHRGGCRGGGRGRDLFIRMPAGNGFVFGNPQLDWGYESTPQPALNGRTIYYPRGKALGGSSIVNGMIYMRGVRADYDGWRQSGLTGWGMTICCRISGDPNPRDRNDEFHGRNGPLKTEPAANFGGLVAGFFIDAAVAAGHEHIDDFNGPRRTGVARVDSTSAKGSGSHPPLRISAGSAPTRAADKSPGGAGPY